MIVVIAAAIFVVVGVHRWATDRRTTWRDLHTIAICGFGATVMAIHWRRTIDDVLNVNNAGHLLAHLLILITGTAISGYALYLRRGTPTNAQVRRRLIVGGVATIAATAAAIPTVMIPATEDLTTPAAIHASYAHLLLYYGFAGWSLIDLASVTAPRVARAWSESKRFGIAAAVLAAGAIITATAMALYLMAGTFTLLTGGVLQTVLSTGIALQPVGILLLIIGTMSTGWIASVQRRHRARDLTSEVTPLWEMLMEVAPELRLSNAVQNEQVYGPEYVLQRRLAEIADGLRTVCLPETTPRRISAVVERRAQWGRLGTSLRDLLPTPTTHEDELNLYRILSHTLRHGPIYV